MTFSLTIECDNAAFGDTPAECSRELVSCLSKVAGKLAGGTIEGRIMDTNGNTVGRFALEERPDKARVTRRGRGNP